MLLLRMASSCSPFSAPLHPSGSRFSRRVHCKHHVVLTHMIPGSELHCSTPEHGASVSEMGPYKEMCSLTSQRRALGLGMVVSTLGLIPTNANGAGLPPEEKPRLCDDACEKELENVAANYVAMVPSGQIFDSSLEKGLPYIFRVGSGQVIKGLDEGILSMKAGGKRRLYIPGSLAFPRGLISEPGRPRVAANSPVIFDVSLEYIPGLEDK